MRRTSYVEKYQLPILVILGVSLSVLKFMRSYYNLTSVMQFNLGSSYALLATLIKVASIYSVFEMPIIVMSLLGLLFNPAAITFMKLVFASSKGVALIGCILRLLVFYCAGSWSPFAFQVFFLFIVCNDNTSPQTQSLKKHMQVEADSGTTTLVYLMNPPYLSASLQQNVQRKRSFKFCC